MRFEGQAVNQTALDNVEHWRPQKTQLLTQLLIDAQRREDVVTGVLELGVYKGWFLSLLAGCVDGLDVPVIGVDAFIGNDGKKLTSKDQRETEGRIHEAIAAVTGKPSRATIMNARTDELNVDMLRSLAPLGLSFIGVDTAWPGSSTADRLVDLAIVSAMLSERGIALFNDLFAAHLPGSCEGFFTYFFRHPEADVVPFATVATGVLLCRRAAYDFYYATCVEILQRPEGDFSELSDAARHLAFHRSISWTPQLLGRAVVPFL